MSLLTEPINRFYYGYLQKTYPASLIFQWGDDATEKAFVECIREAFQAGARWQLRETAALSPHIAKFLEMCILLGPDSPRDEWLMVTDAAPRDDDNEWLTNVPF